MINKQKLVIEESILNYKSYRRREYTKFLPPDTCKYNGSLKDLGFRHFDSDLFFENPLCENLVEQHLLKWYNSIIDYWPIHAIMESYSPKSNYRITYIAFFFDTVVCEMRNIKYDRRYDREILFFLVKHMNDSNPLIRKSVGNIYDNMRKESNPAIKEYLNLKILQMTLNPLFRHQDQYEYIQHEALKLPSRFDDVTNYRAPELHLKNETDFENSSYFTASENHLKSSFTIGREVRYHARKIFRQHLKNMDSVSLHSLDNCARAIFTLKEKDVVASEFLELAKKILPLYEKNMQRIPGNYEFYLLILRYGSMKLIQEAINFDIIESIKKKFFKEKFFEQLEEVVEERKSLLEGKELYEFERIIRFLNIEFYYLREPIKEDLFS